MAVVIDHEQAFKYYCKICKKGFGCGRALGGHMRAHVFGDEPGTTEEDSMNSSMANKCIYSLRTNLNRPRTGNSNSNSNSFLSEEEDLANCLVMLSSGCVNPLEIELSSTSECKEEEEFQMPPRINDNQSKNKRLFECKVCKKVFNSHQALGGHRASHKKVKGCFVEENVIKSTSFSSDHGVQSPWMSTSERRAKRHECSICHRIFTSGQALGGHKRCHWVTSNQTENSIGKNELVLESNDNSNQRYKLRRTEQLDLNLSVPIDLLVEERKEKENLLSLAVSGETIRTTWKEEDDEEEEEDDDDDQKKLTKLSELKDLNMDEDPSQWLKIGIGSSSNEGKGKL